MMKKINLIILCLVQIIVLCAVPTEKVKAAENETAKKIISVVYDDSGSMRDANASWSSANYAMQAFAALLNEKDEIYLTYMSEVGTKKEGAKAVDLKDPQAAVDKIRKESTGKGGTPLHAVEIAMDKLSSVKDEGEGTQFWLIILTDGAMSAKGAKAKNLQKLLNSYKGKKMSNGSEVLIYYMGIGRADTIQDDPQKGLHTIMAGNDIVTALSEVANKVSGRIKFDSSKIKQIDGKTIQIHSELPMYNISVFSQNSKAHVTAAKGERDYQVSRNVSLKSPNEALYGNTAVIRNGSALIQPGDYTITFSEDISLDNMVLMYQLAIEMKPAVSRNGVKLSNVNEIAVGDSVEIELIPTNPETGEQIEESKLPAGIQWGVSYTIDDKEIKASGSRFLTGVKAGAGKNKIICKLQIPEYIPVEQTITFSLKNPVVYGIGAKQSEDDRYARNSLGLKKCEGTADRYYITADGVPMTKDQLETHDLEITGILVDDSNVTGFWNRFGKKQASVKLKREDDGGFSLYPDSIFPAFLIQAGTYQVSLALQEDPGVTAVGDFQIYPKATDWLDLIPVLMFLFLLVYLLYILFGKAKFSGQRLRVEVYKPYGGDGGGKKVSNQCEELLLHKFTLATFLPTKASSRVIPGLGMKVIADGVGGVYFHVDQLKRFQKAGPSSVHPEHNYDGVLNSLKETECLIKTAAGKTVALGGTPYYFKQGKRLYKVIVQ